MNKQNYYVDGNTVRKVPSGQHKQCVQKKKQNKKRRRARARRQNYMSLYYMMFLSGCVIVMCLTALASVYLQADITYLDGRISSTSRQLHNLRQENDEKEQRLAISVDLNDVKVKAEGLGMTEPAEEQIIWYTTDDRNYINQYEEILPY